MTGGLRPAGRVRQLGLVVGAGLIVALAAGCGPGGAGSGSGAASGGSGQPVATANQSGGSSANGSSGPDATAPAGAAPTSGPGLDQAQLNKLSADANSAGSLADQTMQQIATDPG